MGWQGFPLWILNQEASQEIEMKYENETLQFTLQSRVHITEFIKLFLR